MLQMYPGWMNRRKLTIEDIIALIKINEGLFWLKQNIYLRCHMQAV